ncbi:hypothetical protein FA13DRAFT_1734384 [Coprinellus micaceus]|uniref:DUF6533 domain-containing protein n=1 Tax=Coprinellus micaceus TaxID=71717 RepID=A0A4Y7T6M0_COPMI|nr:hypothetical protein FA13DRAFT_1734384 [Coprinellus micaceus]
MNFRRSECTPSWTDGSPAPCTGFPGEMALSAEQIQAIADAVASWRLQECIFIAFYCFYFYYIVTTLDEEVSVILPQRWNRGKTLYMIIRYGLLVVISLQLSRDYKNYFSISPGGCKALYFLHDVTYRVVVFICNFSLALCLSALLRAKFIYCVAIVFLSCALPTVSAILNLMLIIQYPAQPISALDVELGYPCYAPSADEWAEHTPGFLYTGRDIRAYLNLVFTTLLALLGVVAFVLRYRGQGGGLVRVITRDGGMHYLFQLALKLSSAILLTPKLVPPSSLHSSPAYLVLSRWDTIRRVASGTR